MKTLFISFLSFLSTLAMAQTNIHQFNIRQLHSEDSISLADFKGKKILIVNTASKCGFTPQYEDLQKLHELYKDELVIIGFPCNQFLGQESGSEEEIVKFCQKNYGVSFIMTTKIDVKGRHQHPIYTWLTQKELNSVGDYKVSWNFNKFLIDENGNLIAHFNSKVSPLSDDIISLLK